MIVMKRLFTIILCIIVIFSMTACSLLPGAPNKNTGINNENSYNPSDPFRYSPCESIAFPGMNYAQVEALFREAGFENILTLSIDDIDSGSNIKDGAVESVTIDGASEYSTSNTFSAESEVMITYHNIPKLAMPISLSDSVRMPYMDVGKAFFEAGFVSVGTDETYDLPVGEDSKTIISANGLELVEETPLPFDSTINILEHFPISEYSTSININFESNLLFSKYNVVVTIDGEELGILPHGESGVYELKLPAKSYELIFSKENDSEIYGITTLNVNSETSVAYNISCNRKSVDIELTDLSQSLTGSNIMMPFSSMHYLRKDCQSVVKELTDLGFSNVTAIASTDTYWIPDIVNTVVGVDIGGKTAFAHDDLFDKSTDVTVYYHVSDFTFDESAVKVTEKDTFNLAYTLTSGDAIDSISFEIDNPDVIKQNDDGSYTALIPGTATVTASSGGNTYSKCVVEVAEIVIPIERLEFSSSEVFVSVGSIFKIDYKVIPENANYTETRVEISNELVESVENNQFYSYEAGDSEIAFYQGEKFLGTCVVHAEFIEIEDLTVDDIAEETFIGYSFDIPFHLFPDNATNKGISVTSSDPGIAEIVFDERGESVVKVIGKTAGTATISITSPNGLRSTKTITVKEISPSVITLVNSQPSQRIEVGTPISLSIGWDPENTSDKALTWSSSNSKVIKVDSDGKLEAVGVGTAEITAKHKSGVTSTIPLTVEPTLVTKIDLTTDRDDSKKMYSGDKFTITPSLSPENATSKSVTFSSSNESVAVVTDKGIVKAVGVGTTTITVASADGPKTTVPVIVSPAPQKFRITWSTSLISNDHVGNNWSYSFYVNNEPFSSGGSLTLDPESSFIVKYYVEDTDSIPDTGFYSKEFSYSNDFCKNGYTTSETVSVIENSGRYSGHFAYWNLNITIKPI